ncbi:nitronate monooxygenase [bacterium]|nr:nitronate monooxygenase [bacterium]
MEIPKLQIGNLIADFPLIQGGMGVRVSLAPLAAAVANEGGIGTLSTLGLADLNLIGKEFIAKSKAALQAEIRLAKSMTKGLLAVNVMGVSSNAVDIIRTSVEEGIKLIMYGAGLPLRLPEIVSNNDVSLLPIISSPRAAVLIIKTWLKKYNKFPDGFILEGPLAGGHLGFSIEELNHIEDFSLSKLLRQLLEAIKPFELKYKRKIPVISAGGVYTGMDIAENLKSGASAVQMGTRFVCTEECSVSDEFKQAYIEANEEDIQIIQSPVGLPGRALRNKFIKSIESEGKRKIRCNYQCLKACKVDKAHYCIADALINAFSGNVDDGLVFCGQNAYRVEKITTVKKLIAKLRAELEEALENYFPKGD